MVRAKIIDIASHLPQAILSNDDLAALFPEWPSEKIFEKTGILTRHIAAAHETAGDLACAAAENLFRKGKAQAKDVDFIILCTQAPDYILPTTACVLQHRLGIPTSAGALDINLGCSGYVYGLSLANGLVQSGAAQRILLLTADTYSKFIHPQDKSVRTLFGDAATATLVTASNEDDTGAIGPFVFGTDGAGAANLIVETGGSRHARTAASAEVKPDGSGNWRAQDNLYMNGGEVMAFSLTEVPRALAAILHKSKLSLEQVDHVFFHQANKFMLDALRKKTKLPAGKVPMRVADVGNTVSSTIPLTMQPLLDNGVLQAGSRNVLVGFGVGYSWAACSLVF
ncbi:MAG: ketoacyl-ACP synthase III [Rubrivivax sp.]|nr:MAG: ketoacyl-ACP synthase III [Rubrivivax sp.]